MKFKEYKKKTGECREGNSEINFKEYKNKAGEYREGNQAVKFKVRTGKNISTAVRETKISQHHECPNKSSP